jgi:hypothetical protein
MLELRCRLLKVLEACERGLALAYRQRLGKFSVAARQRMEQLGSEHAAHAAALAERLAELGGHPDPLPDDLWIQRPRDRVAALADAERLARDTLRDALNDFDPETRVLVERLIAEHQRMLARVPVDER